MFTFPISLFGGARLLHQFNWATSTFSKIQGVGSLDPSSTAIYHWDCDDASGDLVESLIGGGTHDFTDVSIEDILYQRTAVGISNSLDLASFTCFEIGANAGGSDDYWVSGTTTTMNPRNTSIGFRCVIRAMTVPDGQSPIITHRNGSAVNWVYLAITTSGTVKCSIDDGPTRIEITGSDNVCDGAWHVIEFVVDWTADLMKLRTDMGEESDTSIASIVQANLDAAAVWSCCGNSTGGTQTHNNGFQMLDMWGWEGTAAENLDGDAVSDFWVHATDPHKDTVYEIDTITGSTGTAFVPASDDHLWYGVSLDTSQTSIGYSENLVTLGATNGFGYAAHPAMTNLNTESDRIENWTATNCTVGATATLVALNVYGFEQARRVEATSNDGYVECPAHTISSQSDHACHVSVMGDGAVVTGRLILWDATNTLEHAAQAFSAPNGSWITVSVGDFNIPASDISIRVEIDTSGEAIHLCNAVLDSGGYGIYDSGGHPPCPTFGAQATLPNTQVDIDDTYEWSKQGMMELFCRDWTASPNPGRAAPQKLFFNPQAAQHRVSNYPGNRMITQIYDGGGIVANPAARCPATDLHTGCRYLVSWNDTTLLTNSKNTLGVLYTLAVSGVASTEDHTGTWTGDEELNKFRLGVNIGFFLVGQFNMFDKAETKQ